MPKHTPGPWEWVVEDGDIEIRMGDAIESPYHCLAHNSFKYVDMIETYKKEQKEQAIANADLMTAAPDLLDAAEEMYKIIKNNGYNLRIPVEMCETVGDFVRKREEWAQLIKKFKGENNNE